MSDIVKPLHKPGVHGMRVVSGDGVARRGHPIFAAFIGDYPEQLLVTCCKNGECPSCEIHRNNLGDHNAGANLRNLDNILNALETLDHGPTAYARACREAGIKPVVKPFWQDLPYTNIFQSITPDILHQVYQGVVKHLVGWVKDCCGAVEIDARCRRLPPNHNIRLFMKGISTLSRVTGKEHSQMCSFLLSLIVDIRLPNNTPSTRLVRAVRALLDFVFLAQYPLHTTETLSRLGDALQRFHDNKDIFVDLGIRTNMNLPKLHSLAHYIMYIKLYGTTDNYNTEYTERLHIELAKDAWRATNSKDEFPQMTLWLERKEKIFRHEKFVKWQLSGCPGPPTRQHSLGHLGIVYERHLKMPKHPTLKAVRLDTIINKYGATLFTDALARYIVEYRNPTANLTRAQIDHEALQISLPFRTLPVYQVIKFTTPDYYSLNATNNTIIVDSVHIKPERHDGHGNLIPARFDTVLVNDGAGETTGVKGICELLLCSFLITCSPVILPGYRIGQVRVVFSIPNKAANILFPPHIVPPKHLAYIEWFSPFTRTSEPNHLMYKVKRSLKNGERLVSIIPVTNIRRSAHLLPKFGPVAPQEWTSSNVLELCPTFFVNCTLDRHMYVTLF